ncbi:nucleotide exchange factor GrpE [Ligilactobacillus salivarius]|uniref:Protein GrpE n=1 Tax=Ligilactobacillus salivarius TaxID=1624 RepID=A0A2U2MAP8_9LACO|nr:nucleotide exchange factor GrpE [Ligilactobacillus salivarius]
MIIERGGDVSEEKVKASEQNEDIEKEIKEDDKSSSVENEKSVEETDDSSKALDELQKKYDDIEDKYLRAEAEMANMTQRFKKEQEMLLKYEGQDLARDILPVIDNLNRALEIEVDNDASQQLKKGIEMVARDMEKALKNNNVTKIDSLGKVFDPTLHQAVKTVPVEEGQEPETIVQVFQDGYMLKDRVLRPAMVVVAQ